MLTRLADAVDLSTIRRVLVTKLRHHGDVLLASPVFTVLHRAAPHVEIDALVYSETAAMLEGHPAITQIHTIDRAARRQGMLRKLRAEQRLLSALRARRFDLLVHLTENPRGPALAMLLRPRFSVARKRPSASWLWRTSFTHYYPLPRARERHTVETDLDALRRIGVQPAQADKALVLKPNATAHATVARLMEVNGLQSKQFLQFHPGSRWLFKCWSVEASAELLNHLLAAGWRIVLTGAPSGAERELTDAILAKTQGDVVNLVGQLTLPELAALTSHARAFVGVDSAPMHIAAAMQTPVIALFGPSGEDAWGPWLVPHRVLASNQYPCRPCGNDGCGGGKISECLTTLPAHRVIAALEELLVETAGIAA